MAHRLSGRPAAFIDSRKIQRASSPASTTVAIAATSLALPQSKQVRHDFVLSPPAATCCSKASAHRRPFLLHTASRLLPVRQHQRSGLSRGLSVRLLNEAHVRSSPGRPSARLEVRPHLLVVSDDDIRRRARHRRFMRFAVTIHKKARPPHGDALGFLHGSSRWTKGRSSATRPTEEAEQDGPAPFFDEGRRMVLIRLAAIRHDDEKTAGLASAAHNAAAIPERCRPPTRPRSPPELRKPGERIAPRCRLDLNTAV